LISPYEEKAKYQKKNSIRITGLKIPRLEKPWLEILTRSR
jgi:hypothetical protein